LTSILLLKIEAWVYRFGCPLVRGNAAVELGEPRDEGRLSSTERRKFREWESHRTIAGRLRARDRVCIFTTLYLTV
jgi:hypothetical protein